MNNYIGTLQEKIVSFKKQLLFLDMSYNSTSIGSNFACTLIVSQLDGYSLPERFQVQDIYIEVRSEPQSKKKAAEQLAAHAMLQCESFQRLETILKGNETQPATHTLNQLAVASSTTNTSVASSAFTSGASSFSRTESDCPNPKGRLMEYTQKYTNLKIEFSTTNVAPFVGEVKAYVVSSSADPIVVHSQPHLTKQQANFDASQRMLTHPGFAVLLSMAAGKGLPLQSSHSTVSLSPARTSAAAGSSDLTSTRDSTDTITSLIVSTVCESVAEIVSKMSAVEPSAAVHTVTETAAAIPPPAVNLQHLAPDVVHVQQESEYVTGSAVPSVPLFVPLSTEAAVCSPLQLSAPSLSTSTSELTTPTVSSASSVSSIQASALVVRVEDNPKGRLMEYTQKYTNLKIEFSTSSVAPFVGEVKAYVVSSSADHIVVHSDPHPNKQKANLEASQRMLNHAGFIALLSVVKGTPSRGARPPLAVTPVLIPSKRSADEISSPIIPAVAQSGSDGAGQASDKLPGAVDSVSVVAAPMESAAPQSMQLSSSSPAKPPSVDVSVCSSSAASFHSSPSPTQSSESDSPMELSAAALSLDTPTSGAMSVVSSTDVSATHVSSSGDSTTSEANNTYTHLNAVTHPSESMTEDIEVEGDVQCSMCYAVWGSVHQFCFFDKAELGLEFVVKPEVALHLCEESFANPDLPRLCCEDRLDRKSGEMQSRVVCLSCGGPVGHRMATGLDGAMQFTIGKGKVVVLGVPITESWQTMAQDPRLSCIERRTSANYWGAEQGVDRLRTRPHNNFPVVFPQVLNGSGYADTPDYQYSDLLDVECGKKPRFEQVEALHLALQHHTIVVFPTGFGKTLVASMAMHRFHQLNPRKIAVMVEERVTLVDQQCAVIHNDTGMSVMGMSGNNNTRHVLGKLVSGDCDALVITAGVLHNYLNNNILRISDFSVIVFDECHHTGKEHLYQKIIDKIHDVPLHLRPRVIGLTASPLSKKTTMTATKQLVELRESFFDANMYHPPIVDANTADIHRHPVELSEEQQVKQKLLVAELQPYVDQLQVHIKRCRPGLSKLLGLNKKPIELSAVGVPVEWLRVINCAAASHYVDDTVEAQSLAKKCRALVRTLLDNYLLGPAFVRSRADFNDVVDEALISPQLRTLCSILDQRAATSCTLVFVETRYLSSTVHEYLSRKFPSLQCEQMIGQGGEDGMRYNKQKQVLVDFRRGDCKLIVCTSVLEEGLDVKGCNLVIRLGGTPSLIRLVQSKGRARDKNGELHLIFTTEEETHFDELIIQEEMLHRVLRDAAPRHQAVDRSYLKDFMHGQEQARMDDCFSDVDSVLSCDSGTDVIVTSSESGATEEILENNAPRNKNHGMMLLVCCNAPETHSQLNHNLLNQVSVINGLGKSTFEPRAAHSVVSDPQRRMFSSQDALAIVSVQSNVKRFLRYFSSLWNFSVAVRGDEHPVYILVPPSVKPKTDVKSAVQVVSTPVTSTGPSSAAAPSPTEQPLTVVSPEQTSVSVLSDLHSVSIGWFVGRQGFMSHGQLGVSGSVTYSTVRIEHGRTLLLEAVSAGQRTSVRIPASILSKHAIACATHSSKTVVLYLTLTSTPSVFHEPKYKTDDKKSPHGNERSPFDVDKIFRIFSPNEQPPAPGQGGVGAAQNDLQLLSSAPVIALTFPLAKWKRLMQVFTDPAALGLSVLVTRVQRNELNEDMRAGYRLLTVPTQENAPVDDKLVHKECQYTYATLVSDVYCAALNPAVLSKIKARIESAGDDAPFLSIATTAMLQLHQHLQLTDLWQDALVYFDTAYNSLLTSDSTVTLKSSEPKGYVQMKRILATPSRLLLMPAVPTMTNRLIRMLGDRFQLVYVKFRDEQGQGVYNTAIFDGRYIDMLIHGFDVCGTRFRFLLCSNSQQREATAVFFDGTDQDVEDIRRQIIPDPERRFPSDIAKYISRLGLFCTADVDSFVELDDTNYIVENDIFTKDDVVLTDGSGRCSVAMMKLFQTEFFAQNGYYACEIQIRAKGFKGTLLCDPSLEGEYVVFRDSMQKFETSGCSDTMCVVKAAENNSLTLNREIINLLCAIRDSAPLGSRSWNPESTFVALQDEALHDLGQMLIDPQCAIEKLSEQFPVETLQSLVASGVNILSEPLLMSLLQLIYFNNTTAVRRKTHIPVLHAALEMGAPDPTDILQDGEIFLCVHRAAHKYSGCFEKNYESNHDEYDLGGGIKLIRVPEPAEEDGNGFHKEGFETFVVTGPVLIYRNPCLDPGDPRVVQAVYKPELLFWKNVALLPASTHCKRSLSAECSGGDLDGDMFAVIWDHRLVPPAELVFDAVDYNKVAEQAKQKQGKPDKINWTDLPRKRELVAQFISRAMCNACLGKTAVLHLALCDWKSPRGNRKGKGAADDLAREVAKAQSLAVDFPKTGVAPIIPPEAKKLVREHGRPHFMEKTEMLSYLSQQSLGVLYNVVSTVACTVQLGMRDRGTDVNAFYFRNKSTFRTDSEVQAVEDVLREEATLLYAAYKREVQSIMLRFGLRSEAEMVLGAPQSWSDEFALDHEAAAQSLTACWKALKKVYGAKFSDSLSDALPETRLLKASVWYEVAYDGDQEGKPMGSFAWVVSEDLANIRKATAAATAVLPLLTVGEDWQAHRDVAAAVGRSAVKSWRKSRHMLQNAVQMKENIYQKIRDAIFTSDVVRSLGVGNIDVHRFGSTVLLLCDPQSDVDITVHVPARSKQSAQDILETIVFPSLTSISMQSDFVKGAHVPLLKMRVEDGYNGTAVDVSAQNMEGVYKSALIRHLYSENPENLFVFSNIVQWARCSGLLRGFVLEDRKSLLNSGQLQALIVSFLLHSSDDNMFSADQLSDAAVTSADILARADDVKEEGKMHLGETLLSFFAHYSRWQPEETFHYSWPIPGAPTHTIGAKDMEEVRACCRRALHCLFVSWDWGYLLEHSVAFEKARTSLQMELSATLSKGISSNREFFAMLLRCKSKAQVSISSVDGDSSRLIVQGSGRYQQIQVLQHELLQLIYSGRMQSYGAVRTMSNAYFMEGSAFLYTRGTATKDTMLTITPVCVDDHLLRHIHVTREQSTVTINDIVLAPEHIWREEFKRQFCSKMLEQMLQLGKVRADGQVIFSVHMGKMLLLDASQSFEKSRGARSCNEIEAAMDSVKGNMKMENYRTEAPAEKKATTAEQKKPAAGSGTGGEPGGGEGRKVKSHLTTAFVSGVPIARAADGTAQTASGYETQMALLQEKFEQVCGSLNYSKCDLQSLPVTGAAWCVPGTSLTVPTSEWRTAVDLTDTQQINFELGPDGEIRNVAERFVSFVNGTLVDPVLQQTTTLAESEETVVAEEVSSVYDFKQHDLRFKFGIMNPVSVERQNRLFSEVCPDGRSPIKYFPSSELVAEAQESSVPISVTSRRMTEYTQAHLLTEKDFTCVQPSPSLSRPDMVSFARHVFRRCAYFSPEVVRSGQLQSYVQLAPNVEDSPPTSAKVMAIMALGEHFEDAQLQRINPFVDISLEVDATRLLQAMPQTGKEATGESDDESQVELLGLTELNTHIADICDELLRVSAQIKKMW